MNDTSTRHQSLGVVVRPGSIYRLATALDTLPPDLTLLNVEWGVLFAITGEHTVSEIGDHFGLGVTERLSVFARLVQKGLVEEREVGYGEYLRAATSVRDSRPRTLAAFLRDAPSLPLEPAAPRAAEPSRRFSHDEDLTRPVPTVERVGDSITFSPLSAPSRAVVGVPDEEPARQLSLERMMRFIIDQAPDTNAGQLDVYRVFIRVDTKLLKRNGITTLRFADDRLIDDPELQDAIASSVERTLGIDVPETVYVAA